MVVSATFIFVFCLPNEIHERKRSVLHYMHHVYVRIYIMLLGTIYAIIQNKWSKFAMRLVDHALSPFPNKHLKSLVRKP